jgi:hypothetical protein
MRGCGAPVAYPTSYALQTKAGLPPCQRVERDAHTLSGKWAFFRMVERPWVQEKAKKPKSGGSVSVYQLMRAIRRPKDGGVA